MDQRLTSKRWLLALSVLLLAAIAVLLAPEQITQQHTHDSSSQQLDSSAGIDDSARKRESSAEGLALLPLATPLDALPLENVAKAEFPNTDRRSATSLGPLEFPGELNHSQVQNPDDADAIDESADSHAPPHPLLGSDASPKHAIFEEVIGERPFLRGASAHQTALFKHQSHTDPTASVIRLTEWRKLLGVQIPPDLDTAQLEQIDSPDPNKNQDDQLTDAEEEPTHQYEGIPAEGVFSPLVIATVPDQEQYVRATSTATEKVTVATALNKDDEIVDDEGYWEPIADSAAPLLTLPSVENAAPESASLRISANHVEAITTADVSEAKSPTNPNATSAQATNLYEQADQDPGAWQLRPAVLDSSGNAAPMMLPTATPVVPQNSIANDNATPDGEDEEKEQPDPEPPSAQESGNEDKKMIGHLAGKFGTCFQSAISCGFYFGNEFTFLAAETPGTTRVRMMDTISTQAEQFSGEDAFGFGNRITLGIQAKNIGFRFIYWAYEGGYSNHDAWQDQDLTPVFSTNSKVGLETFDIDLMQRYCFLGCNLMTACGVRFAEYQGSEFTTLSSNTQGLLEISGNTRSYRSMEGVGPTFFVELRKTIPWCLGSPARMPYGMFDPGSTGCFGCCESNCSTYGNCGGCGGGCDACSLGSPCFPWRFYANFRVSALWADTYSESMTESVVATGDGVVTQGIARGRDKATLGIDDEKSLVTTQIQFGLEHRTPIMCNRALWICRLGFEIQSWDTGKHESKSQSFAFLEDPNDQFGGRVETLSRADNRYLNLCGFTFLLGLNY